MKEVESCHIMGKIGEGICSLSAQQDVALECIISA